MTAQDEARELLLQLRTADDELTAVRTEIDAHLRGRYGSIFVDTADGLAAKLAAAKARKAKIEAALSAVNAESA